MADSTSSIHLPRAFLLEGWWWAVSLLLGHPEPTQHPQRPGRGFAVDEYLNPKRTLIPGSPSSSTEEDWI